MSQELVDDEDDFSTHWTKVYRFNAVVLAIVSALFICFLSCAPFTVYSSSTSRIKEPILCCQIFCTGCAACPTLAAIIYSAVRIYNPSGDLCASNTDVYMVQEDGIELTWAGDASVLRAVFKAQAILHVPMFMCAILSNLSFFAAHHTHKNLQRRE